MSEDKLKDIIQNRVQKWEQSEILQGEPQPSEMVWDKVNSSLPVKSWSMMHIVVLYSTVAVLSFGLGYFANEVVKNKNYRQSLQDEAQSEIPLDRQLIDTSHTSETPQTKVKKRTVEIIDMDSIEKSKEKDYILYNNSKIYLNKKDSTSVESTPAQ